jgi:protein SCO1/2
MKFMRPTALLVAALAAAACDSQEPGGATPPEQPAHPSIVELNEPLADAPDLTPIGGDTGLLAAPVGELPDDYAFVDEKGAERTFADLRGKFVLVDFIFTECSGPCPPMAAQMGALQKRLGVVDDVVLLSITVDPKNDTPDVLADYARSVGADPGTWGFARMPIGFVNELTREEFLVGDGGTPFAHTTKFLLVDRQGRGRAHYDPLVDAAWIDKLLADVDKLRSEGP